MANSKKQVAPTPEVTAMDIDEMLDNSVEAFALDTEAARKFKELVVTFNNAVIEENVSLMVQTEKALKEALKALNDEEKAAQVQAWAASTTPVVTCLTEGGVYALTSVKRDKDVGTIEISGKSAIVDLKDLFKVAPTAFAEKTWMAHTEAANIAIRDYIAKVMGIKTFTEKLSGFKLSATAKMLKISVTDMKTAKGTCSALQRVVDSILGTGYTVTSEDAEAFRYNYSQWGNKAINSVSLSMEATFRKQLTRIMVRIVNDMEYMGE